MTGEEIGHDRPPIGLQGIGLPVGLTERPEIVQHQIDGAVAARPSDGAIGLCMTLTRVCAPPGRLRALAGRRWLLILVDAQAQCLHEIDHPARGGEGWLRLPSAGLPGLEVGEAALPRSGPGNPRGQNSATLLARICSASVSMSGARASYGRSAK